MDVSEDLAEVGWSTEVDNGVFILHYSLKEKCKHMVQCNGVIMMLKSIKIFDEKKTPQASLVLNPGIVI